MLTVINGKIKWVGEESDQKIQLAISKDDYEKFKEYERSIDSSKFYADFLLDDRQFYVTGFFEVEEGNTVIMSIASANKDANGKALIVPEDIKALFGLNDEKKEINVQMLKHPRKQVEELSAKINTLNVQIEEHAQQVDELAEEKAKAQVEELNTKINTLNAQIEEHAQQVDELAEEKAKAQVEELNTKINTLNAQIANLKEQLQTQLTKAKDEKTTLEEQLKKKGEELEIANKTIEEQVKELEATNKKAKEEKTELETQLNQANTEKTKLQNQLTEAQNKTTEQPKQGNGARYTATVGMGLAAGLIAFTALERTVRLDIWVMVGIAVVSTLAVGSITYAALPSTQVNGAEVQGVSGGKTR